MTPPLQSTPRFDRIDGHDEPNFSSAFALWIALTVRMFDYEVRPSGYSPALFIIQLVLAPLGGLILGLLVYVLLEGILRVRNSNVLGYVGFSVQGFILGYKMQTAFPRAIESWGSWIWTVPVCNLGLWILGDNGPNSQVADFFVFPPGPGLGGIGIGHGAETV